jgi:conjugative transfer region lipoprotein (TIGR03751 family)
MAAYSKLPMILAWSNAFLLTACTSSAVTAKAIPEGGLTVSQLYQQSIEAPLPSWSVKRSLAQSVNYEGYTRTATNEINALFKPLDNPQIPIYIFPHVALIGDEQLLKPGYTTAFFLYKQNQFALASEHY